MSWLSEAHFLGARVGGSSLLERTGQESAAPDQCADQKDPKGTFRGGIGKPEPLKHGLAGYWSRRMIDEHRIV